MAIDVDKEQRQAERKGLKVKAVLAMDDAPSVAARTLDVATSGACVTAPGPVKPGATGKLSFDMYHDGQASTIVARVTATYCIFSNGEFKIGFQFTNLALSSLSALAKYVR